MPKERIGGIVYKSSTLTKGDAYNRIKHLSRGWYQIESVIPKKTMNNTRNKTKSYYLERINKSQVIKRDIIVVILDVTECLLVILH